MILDRQGESVRYLGVTYAVGQTVVVTGEDPLYQGLKGKITEILDGEQNGEEDNTIQLYLTMEEPESQEGKSRLIQRCSELYPSIPLQAFFGSPIEMSPEMVSVVKE